MFAGIKNFPYICTAIGKQRYLKLSKGSLGEWLKPAVC